MKHIFTTLIVMMTLSSLSAMEVMSPRADMPETRRPLARKILAERRPFGRPLARKALSHAARFFHTDPANFMSVKIDEAQAVDEATFWLRQISEHMLFLHLGIEEAPFKE